MYKTTGIIIKTADSGEFDRLLTIYTKDFGKILAKAKSVKKNQAKLRGHLELFLYSHLMLVPAKGLPIISGAEVIESFPYLHRSLPSLASAYYFSELIDKLLAGPEKDERIWALLFSSFQKLNQPEQELKLLVKDFENKLVEFLGYGVNQLKPLSFIESLISQKINSKRFLENCLAD